MGYRNNRLIVIQNFGSIQHNRGALAALGQVLATAPLTKCFVDGVVGLSALRLNSSAWRLGWANVVGDDAMHRVGASVGASLCSCVCSCVGV